MQNSQITQQTHLCYHCGENLNAFPVKFDDKEFCCEGCKTVFEILSENDLCAYYDLEKNAGISLKSKNLFGKYDFLESPEIENELVDFGNEEICKVSFYIPNIHCSSCVWLLENLHKIKSGVLYSRLNFVKKELSFSYNPKIVRLKEIVELLDTLGYAPTISLENSKQQQKPKITNDSLVKKIGIVGFCVGNIMLLSFPEYFHLDIKNSIDNTYQKFFLYLNFILSIPVFFYGGSDYLKGAYFSLKDYLAKKSDHLSVDIPIALGISTLFIRSCFETFINHSAGYWDSLAGLVFFLLVGKWLQQTTFDFLRFERDYKSFFPLGVRLISDTGNITYKNVTNLQKGEIIQIHNEELIPTDATLLSEKAKIDYSFVTGESNLIKISKNDKIRSGGRLIGESAKFLVQKSVSQSYLTQLWNNELFIKEKEIPSTKIANSFSKYFTFFTLTLAFLTGTYWYFIDKSIAFGAITAVLMVACPCALTLSLPFTMNTAMGILGKHNFFVKNQTVIQWLAEINHIVFDKTGTLTHTNQGIVNYFGESLQKESLEFIHSLSSNSTHPLSKILSLHLHNYQILKVENLIESKGYGISGEINGFEIRLGSAEYMNTPTKTSNSHSVIHVSINNIYLGYFEIKNSFRYKWKQTLQSINLNYKTTLLSGDNKSDYGLLLPYFKKENLKFSQKPLDKLNYIKNIQEKGDCVAMIGDGLNDAGALRQSNVGIALTEDIHAFTPSCDAILDADRFNELPSFINFSKKTLGVVKLSFLLSLVYNYVGLSWAVSGKLTPVMAAIFMPLSSISVVLFAVLSTYIMSKLILNK